MKPGREPTFTSVVLNKLRAADDLVNIAELEPLLPEKNRRSRLWATLCHLRKMGVVEFFLDNNVWWVFALPPEGDKRSRIVEEILHDYKKRPRARKTVLTGDDK